MFPTEPLPPADTMLCLLGRGVSMSSEAALMATRTGVVLQQAPANCEECHRFVSDSGSRGV